MTKTATCCDRSAGRGRPPDPEKREAIIAAASRLFMDHGYGISMEAIATEAGVSKQTIYNLFSTKEELFGKIVAGRSEMIVAPLRPLLDNVDLLREDTAPGEVLLGFARHFLELVASDCVTKVYTMMLSVDANAGGQPLREFYFKNGPMRTVGYFVDYLARQHEKGTLRVPDPELAAESFLGMLSGFNAMRHALGIAYPSDAETIDRKVRYCVGMFLREHGTRDTAASA
jgi:TetR/AcrR family transcriptional repressor of mexJK operon